MKEKNGIKYKNGLPTSTNGSWIQTLVYLVDAISKNQNILLDIMSNNNTTTNLPIIEDTIETTPVEPKIEEVEPITVVKEVVLPRETHIEIFDPHPLTRKPKIIYKKEFVTSKPIIKSIPKKDLYTKCCGLYNPTNSTYLKCMRRVDECYNKVKECKGEVLPGDMTNYRINLPDCGCSSSIKNC